MKNSPSAKDIADAIHAAEKRTAHSYASAFAQRSSEPDDGWRLLQAMFSMHERLHDPGQPFGPMMTTQDGRRTFLPEDLTGEQLEWLQRLEGEIEEVEFRARIADVLWLCARDRRAAARAVVYYLDAGLALEDLDHWTESIGRYSRAYTLATQLGRRGQLRLDVLDFLLARLRNVKGDDPRWWSLKVMYLLYEARHGKHQELIEYANTAATRAEQECNFRRQRDYLEFVAKLHNRDQNRELAEAVRVE